MFKSPYLADFGPHENLEDSTIGPNEDIVQSWQICPLEDMWDLTEGPKPRMGN